MKKLLFCSLLLLFGTYNYAQESVNAAGGDATGAGGSASYSIGQPFAAYYSSSSGSVSEGVQHAYEVFLTDVKEELSWNAEVNLFPNPTTNLISIELTQPTAYRYQLYSLDGKLLQDKEVTDRRTEVNMQDYPAATYLLKIMNSEGKFQTYKIVKTQR